MKMAKMAINALLILMLCAMFFMAGWIYGGDYHYEKALIEYGEDW